MKFSCYPGCYCMCEFSVNVFPGSFEMTGEPLFLTSLHQEAGGIWRAVETCERGEK